MLLACTGVLGSDFGVDAIAAGGQDPYSSPNRRIDQQVVKTAIGELLDHLGTAAKLEGLVTKNHGAMGYGVIGLSTGYYLGEQFCSLLFAEGEAGSKISKDNTMCRHSVAVAAGAFGAISGWGPANFLDDLQWSVRGLFGQVRPVEGLARIYPCDAVRYDRLVFDQEDPASLWVKSIASSMKAKQPMENGVFYGDAGTGKTSVVHSFAHIPGYEVWSVTAAKMDLNQFKLLTRWIKHNAKPNRKILVDISEGDNLLWQLAFNSEFKAFFKQNYQSKQDNYALIFSCNFSMQVAQALKNLSMATETGRRLGARVRFTVPGPVVRLRLLYASIKKAISHRRFYGEVSQQVAEEKQARTLKFFEEKILQDSAVMEEVVLYTDGLSHDEMIVLGHNLVYLYKEAIAEQKQALEEQESDDWTLFNGYAKHKSTRSLLDPEQKIIAFIKASKTVTEWVAREREELVKKEMDEIKANIPLLRLQAMRDYYLRRAKEEVVNPQQQRQAEQKQGQEASALSKFGAPEAALTEAP